MRDWSATLPYPVGVSTNHLYRGRGRYRQLTAAALAWRELAIIEIRQEHQRLRPRQALAIDDGRLAFWLDVWTPDDGREHDGDNLIKFTIDTIMTAFGEIGDARVGEHHVSNLGPSPRPRLGVMLTAAAVRSVCRLAVGAWGENDAR